jgi:hypothetical protein
MKHYLTLALLVSAAVTAQVPEKTQPNPSDFAMQLPLRLSGDNGVVQLQLPLIVYQHAQSATLADVRVFNSAGQPVPFAFFQPTHSSTTQWRESEVKLFPLLSDATDDSSGQLELDVRASQDGALLSVHAKGLGKQSTGKRLIALILDLGKSPAGESLDSLQLFLPDSVTESYRADLAIEQSDDLKLWDRVAQSRIDWLKSAGQDSRSSSDLVNDRIPLSARAGRYVRIQWLEGKPLQFKRVVARWRSSASPADETMEVVLKPAPGKLSGDWAYASSPAIAADEIGLNLPNPNTVMPVSIGFYRQQLKPTRKWVFDAMTANTFYRLNQNGIERVSSRLHIAPQGSNEWVVHPQTATTEAPELVLRWHPHTIVFTAQGGKNESENASFILAFGASAEKQNLWLTSKSPLSLVAPGFSDSDLNQLEHAMLGEAIATPASTQATIAVETAEVKINKRTLWLWGVLIFGTLLLAGMSWRLYKQMNSGDKRNLD